MPTPTSCVPPAQVRRMAEHRAHTEAAAAAYIRDTQGDTAELLLAMLGLDGVDAERQAGVCRRCGNELPRDYRRVCRRVACLEAATAEALTLAAGANMPLPKGLA